MYYMYVYTYTNGLDIQEHKKIYNDGKVSRKPNLLNTVWCYCRFYLR